MKKLLLGSAAIAGLVFASAPAAAQMELTIGGHSKNYVGWLEQDEAVGTSVKAVDMQRETELHFNGESTLDNGLTIGFQVEAEVDAGDDDNTIEESYIYASGTWGRVNLGSEDGAAYLLQVSAPSADSNIDGIRQYIQPVNYASSPIGLVGNSLTAGPSGATNVEGFDYDQDITGVAEKITYLSPNYNGLQIGASFTPSLSDDNSEANLATGFNVDTAGSVTDEAWEIAARYEGVLSNFGYAVGFGYTDIDTAEEWNVGLDVDTGPFGIGAAYKEFETDASSDSNVDTLVIGADYTTGPFKFGFSWFNQEDETLTTAEGEELDTDRYTAGVIYTAGPGLSFRGSVSQIDQDVAAAEVESTSILGGVQINF